MTTESLSSGLLRERLKAARVARNLTQQDVADAVARTLGRDSLRDTTISNWESNYRQPGLDEFQAWALAVGMRLVLDLVPASSPRMAVMVQRDRAELAKELDVLSDEQLASIASIVRQFIRTKQ